MNNSKVNLSFTNDEINGLISHFMEMAQNKEEKYRKLKKMAQGIGDEYNQPIAECAQSELANKLFFEHILRKLTDAQHSTV